jgi:hypothetical protein
MHLLAARFGFFFLGDGKGFLKEGVKSYLMAPISHLNLPTHYLIYLSSHLYSLYALNVVPKSTTGFHLFEYSTVRLSNFDLGTHKWGFSCKVQRQPPADIPSNESLPQKTPSGHHVHGRHGHGSPVKNRWRFSKFCKKIRNFDPHFNNLYLARKWV